MTDTIKIFDAADVAIKIKRLSIQILEDCIDEKSIILLGIEGGGSHLASLLFKELKRLSDKSILNELLSIDKKKPLEHEIKLSIDVKELKNKVVIMVDDVSNSGRTLFYAMNPLTQITPKSIKVLLLVDRQYKKFPIHADYVGNSLSTTMNEHIDVVFENKQITGVYLS